MLEKKKSKKKQKAGRGQKYTGTSYSTVPASSDEEEVSKSLDDELEDAEQADTAYYQSASATTATKNKPGSGLSIHKLIMASEDGRIALVVAI